MISQNSYGFLRINPVFSSLELYDGNHEALATRVESDELKPPIMKNMMTNLKTNFHISRMQCSSIQTTARRGAEKRRRAQRKKIYNVVLNKFFHWIYFLSKIPIFFVFLKL